MSNQYRGYIGVLPTQSNGIGTGNVLNAYSDDIDIGARIDEFQTITEVRGFSRPKLKNIDPSAEITVSFDADDVYWLFQSHFGISKDNGGTYTFYPIYQQCSESGNNVTTGTELVIVKTFH